jgi:hypothetical protein
LINYQIFFEIIQSFFLQIGHINLEDTTLSEKVERGGKDKRCDGMFGGGIKYDETGNRKQINDYQRSL